MEQSRSLGLWCRYLLGASIVLLALSGCGSDGSDGDDGAPGSAGPPGPPGAAPAATGLNFLITGVTISSAPVVNFGVTNEGGFAYPGIGEGDLRFNIAKLIPAVAAAKDTSEWQNYIVSVSESSGAMRGSQERFQDEPTDVWGQLINHGDGSYTYTFETDITNVDCPAPCTEADGTPLDLSYHPDWTHRVSIQQGNRTLPQANGVYDFVPATGPVASSGREIIKTANCNECHDKITAHGSRFETKLCVTCHNPGSWAKNDDDTTTPVDFKVMIHKIHRGENLPSVEDGGSYAVGRHDFSDVVFPQDIRNCTKCHDGDDPDTPQGNNWQLPNIAACGSCHDDIDFANGSGHPGGAADNSMCLTCHAEDQWAGSVAESHTIPGKAERALFQFNILEICGTPVANDPVCVPGSSPTVTFSVTDPSGTGEHQYGDTYNIMNATTTDPEYKTSAPTNSAARLSLDMAWDTLDYSNDVGGSDLGIGTRPSRAFSVNLLTSPAVSTTATPGVYLFDGADNVNSSGDAPLVIPANASIAKPIGSGAVALEGRAAAYDEDKDDYSVRVPVNSPVEYFAVNDAQPQPRRQVVDATTKCDRCHDVLSAHGGSRNNNGQLCVMCHNSSMTDVNDREARDDATGLPLPSSLNGRTEESVDFKRLIHGIHAASKSNFDGTPAHGFREQGLLIGSELDAGTGDVIPLDDFSHVRFPGVLSKCETCHLPDTYTLADRSAKGGGNWELPAMNGIRGSTVHSYPSADPNTAGYDITGATDIDDALRDQADDYKYSPIASACSACHDGTLSQAHMEDNGGLFGFINADDKLDGFDQNFQEGNIESCPVCHGPGKLADVKLVHDEAFADFLGEFIP